MGSGFGSLLGEAVAAAGAEEARTSPRAASRALFQGPRHLLFQEAKAGFSLQTWKKKTRTWVAVGCGPLTPSPRERAGR